MSNPPTKENPYSNNIWKYNLAMIFRNLWITMPVSIIFYQDKGLTFLQMGIIEGIISILIFFTDIPSGAFADVFGRKLSSTLGLILWGLSMILTGFFNKFGGFLFAAILLGLGDSLLSGSLSALFYDTLKELNQEDRYIKLTGQRDAFCAISVITSAILGSFLYNIRIELPFIAHGSVLLIAAFIIATMKEPKIEHEVQSIKTQFQLIGKSIKFTIHHSKVRFISIFWILIISVPMLFVNLMEQPYLEYQEIPLIWWGVIFALTRGVIGFFAPLRYKIEKKIGERGSFYGLTIIYVGFFTVMLFLHHWSIIIILFFFFFSRDYSWSILDKYANDHIPSKQRATVLSIINFGVNAFYFLIVLLAGYSLDNVSLFGLSSLLSTIFFLICICGFVILPYLIANYKKFDKKSDNVKIIEEKAIDLGT